ncbi:hypothetical protein RBSWK_03644 [Rhodopirellula baltica SWK14]|uniref:Uncharacterized protein n=1 Tax=Rhodopirellula baltica SWK14 TaxID=993516 RepID=L7CFZ9_RHOBT|nr:hypothetical protein RBSWK_03644 [Rhodopirellula baltica SWK14]
MPAERFVITERPKNSPLLPDDTIYIVRLPPATTTTPPPTPPPLGIQPGSGVAPDSDGWFA